MKNITSILLLQAFIIQICFAMQEDVNFLALLPAAVFQKDVVGCLGCPDVYTLKRTCTACNNDVDFSHTSPLYLSALFSEICTKRLIFFAQQKRKKEFTHFFMHNNYDARKQGLISFGWADNRLNDMDYCMNAYCNPVHEENVQMLVAYPLPSIVIEMACYAPRKADKNVTLSRLFLYDIRWNKVKERFAHWLKRSDVDVNIQDSFSNAALFHLYVQEKIDLLKQLLAHPDVDVNVRDVHNQNLLISALWRKDVEMVSVLLQHPKIDRTVRDCNNLDIYQIATANGLHIHF